MPPERRFQGPMSADYRLIRLTISHFEALQNYVGELVARLLPPEDVAHPQVLEIGCGDGATSARILAAVPHAFLTSVDNEEAMVEQATANLHAELQANRCRILGADALDYVRGVPPASVDLVASALALHNMERSYRARLYAEIFRVLRPGGHFLNADKFARDEKQRFDALHESLAKIFDVLLPLGKLELLRDTILHNVADQAPERVLWEDETCAALRALGFVPVDIPYRDGLQAVLVASKPRA